MNFKVYKSGKQLNGKEINFNGKKIIFIFHGLFGRAKNWHSIALKISSIIEDYLIVFDLRNHGENPQSDQISYSLMVNDVYEFVKRSKISKLVIIGHSMGGKLGMLFSLIHPTLVKQLFVVDIAPVEYPTENSEIVDLLLNANIGNCRSRNEADLELAKFISNKELRSFLLQNLNFNSGKYSWSLNLNAIKLGMKDLRGFPFHLISNVSDIKTICIYGEKSPYLNESYKKQFGSLFLNLKFVQIDNAGHWLHVEKPEEFINILSKNLI